MRATPVPMDMGGTKSEAVVKESGVNDGPVLCSFQEVTQVTQMPVATSDSVSRTVLVQDEHLAWAEPSLHNKTQRYSICHYFYTIRCISAVGQMWPPLISTNLQTPVFGSVIFKKISKNCMYKFLIMIGKIMLLTCGNNPWEP